MNEFEDDFSEKEEVPSRLENKWREDEKKGRAAGICKHCGWPYTEDELSCRHCENPLEILPKNRWMSWNPFASVWGWISVLILIVAFIAYIF